MCHIIVLHLIVLLFPHLFVTTNPGGVETYCLQTVVAAAECSFHIRDPVAAGGGTVADIDVFLRILVDASSKIVLC